MCKDFYCRWIIDETLKYVILLTLSSHFYVPTWLMVKPPSQQGIKTRQTFGPVTGTSIWVWLEVCLVNHWPKLLSVFIALEPTGRGGCLWYDVLFLFLLVWLTSSSFWQRDLEWGQNKCAPSLVRLHSSLQLSIGHDVWGQCVTHCWEILYHYRVNQLYW